MVLQCHTLNAQFASSFPQSSNKIIRNLIAKIVIMLIIMMIMIMMAIMTIHSSSFLFKVILHGITESSLVP